VIDVSNPDYETHIQAVETILEKLGLASRPTVMVLNKTDRFPDKELLAGICRQFNAIAVSALQPETVLPLISRLEAFTRNFGTKKDRQDETSTQ